MHTIFQSSYVYPERARNFFLVKTWNSHAVIWLHHTGLKDCREYNEICINTFGRGDTALADGVTEWDLKELTSNEKEEEIPTHGK